MSILFAVIDDLYTFSLRAVLSLVKFLLPTKSVKTTIIHAETREPAIHEVLDSEAELFSEDIIEPTFKSFDSILKEQRVQKSIIPHVLSEEKEEAIGKTNIMYVGAEEVLVYKNPTIEFDSIVACLVYGDMVMVFEERGRWSSVVSGEKAGWVLREELFDKAGHVYPSFTIGVSNAHDNPNTLRVRAMLKDTFNASALGLPLQSGEYVLYRLLRKGLKIIWPLSRPRIPGVWHTLLHGVQGISVGDEPKTGSIMEYMTEDDMGHLAYVESVFPDETITISETNFPDSGIYNERVIVRDEWRKFSPKFIQVI